MRTGRRASHECGQTLRDECADVARIAILIVAVTAVNLAVCLRVSEAGPAPLESEGERLAQMVCSACHIVAVRQDTPPILKKPVPDFCEIANRPGTTAHSLSNFVMHTHWDEESSTYTMPSPMLNADQAKAISQYILSLRGHCNFQDAHPS